AYWNRHRQAARRHQAAKALRQALAVFYAARQAENPDFRQAMASLSTVMETHPETSAASQAALYLGHIAYAHGDYARSLEHYRQATGGLRAESPFLEVALLDVAYALEAQREYSQARAAYQRVIELQGGVLKDRAVIGIGRSYEQQGTVTTAIKTYQLLLARFPNSPWADEVRQRLNLLQTDRKAKSS
ncbi:MAG: tetratricopeptide repeat protein, partial [Nitrospinota bacterium]